MEYEQLLNEYNSLTFENKLIHSRIQQLEFNLDIEHQKIKILLQKSYSIMLLV